MNHQIKIIKKRAIRVSRNMLKAPKAILDIPKSLLELGIDVLDLSIDVLDNPEKITEVPKHLLNIPASIVDKIIKTFFTINRNAQSENFDDQEEIIFWLIKKCRGTMFGKRYGFRKIKSIQDFQNQVPIFRYKEYEPRVHAMLKGEEDIAYPWKIDRFAVSSGTTGTSSKYIPVTREWLKKNHFKWGTELMAFYIKNNPRSHFLKGKGLVIWGIFQKNVYTGDDNVGFISAILQKNTPWFIKGTKEPNESVAYIENREEKLDAIVQQTVNKNITFINGSPGWLLNVLYKVLEYTGKKNILEVRPNLELFFWGGLPITLYKDQFEKLIPSPKMKYYQVYNASEWFFWIQDENEADDMLLLTDHGTFYEFISMDEYHCTNPKVVTLQEVEVNKEYAMLITNCSGMRRYDIGDIIVFTKLQPRKIKITGRTKYYIDMIGERVFLSDIEKAVIEACKRTDTIIAEYTVGPNVYEWVNTVDKSRGAHERLIEFIKAPQDVHSFAKVLDQILCENHAYYACERLETGVLWSPIVHALPQGSFYTRLKSKNKLGGQYKVTKLSNDRSILDEVLKIANNS
jgi:phenylacetate-coenzyme A ligase PaaK-like adenylate-forming protein